MAEYIEREKLMEAIASRKMSEVVPNCYQPKIKEAVCKLGQAIKKIISEHPTADVVEVVRCKDCEHWQVSVDGIHTWCSKRMSMTTNKDDFCSFGVKKDGKGEGE